MLDDSFDALGNSLDRLEAVDAMNTAAILNAIEAMRAEFEAKAEEVSAQLGGLSGELTAGNARLKADMDRILELVTELAAKKAAEGA